MQKKIWATFVATLAVASVVMPGALFNVDTGTTEPDKGKELFDRHCGTCHTKSEKTASYLQDDVAYFIKAGVPAQSMGMLLRKPVRSRPPGANMPAFSPKQLSDADLDLIGLYLASGTVAPKTPLSLGNAEKGKPLYSKHCAVCHGSKGQGVGKFLPLAVFANQLKEAKTPSSVILGFVMLSCRSGSVAKMPTYSTKKLSDKDLAHIASYIWAMPMPTTPIKR